MKTMRLAIITIVLAAISIQSYAAMHLTDIRREARFLTDRMGYELGLSNRQYNDVYEINFDFLCQVNEVIDDVVYGYDDAIDYYYYLLDVRNEDLMYVLRNRQYRRFIKRDYFYRPLYMVGHTWGLRIYERYADCNFYYFGAPICYHTYVGAHYRIHFAHSYYAGLYNHALYHGAFRLWGGGYEHYHHDGWRCSGKYKYDRHIGSRPWSNAKNYENSRRDLRAGYVSVPSRDDSKRKVSIGSEESRRTAVTSNMSSRRNASDARANTSMVNNSSSTSRPATSTATTVRTSRKNAGASVSTKRNPSNSSSSSARSSRSSTSTSASTKKGSTSSVGSSVRSSRNSGNSSASAKNSSSSSRNASVSSSRKTSSKNNSSSSSRSGSSSSRSNSSSRSGSR